MRQRFDTRLTCLQTSLDALESIEANTNTPPLNVWTTTGSETITRRMLDFFDQATDEIILIVNGQPVITDRLLDQVRAAHDRGVEIYVGTLSDVVYDRLRTALLDVTLFESELDWLQPRGNEDEAIGRLLLVDRETLLVSSIGHHSLEAEAALWSEGVDNGLLVIARRPLATGLDGEGGIREVAAE